MPKRIVRLAIREFVESMFMEGDLAASSSPARAVEGMRVHKGMQAERGEDYSAEVPVSFSASGKYVELQLFGRIDGLTVGEHGAAVEEIKTVRGILPERFGGTAVHWAQAKAYAAIYCHDNGVDQIVVRLVYFDTLHSETHPFERICTSDELLEWLHGICNKYIESADREEERLAGCGRLIREKGFPYERLRPGQREMIDAVYDAVKSGGLLYVSAPTGIGKTMGALFPAVKALADGHCRKIFYLTARNPVKTVAEEALNSLIVRGFALRGIVMAAKESLCPMPGGTPCGPDTCERAEGFYDRLHAALDEVPPVGCMSRKDVEALAERHRLCPHELSLSIAEISDVVICDYNNAFDPRVRIRRFFDRGGEYALLVDEAHNLVDRGRDMFSAALSEAQIRSFADGLPLFLPEGAAAVSAAAQAMLGSLSALGLALAETGQEEAQLAEVPGALMDAVEDFVGAAEPLLAYRADGDLGEGLTDLYFTARFFREISEEADERYRVILRGTPEGLELHIRCIDPSARLRETLDKIGSAVFYSATLTPFPYYARLTGAGGDASFLSLPSPFPHENLSVVLLDVDTTYARREKSLDKLADALTAFVRGRRGNYLVFFPSYRYMQAAHELFRSRNPAVFAPIQRSGMGERDRTAFLRHFDEEHEDGMAAFAVMGGIFGEGIDLVGDKVIGVAIAGVGMPQICLEKGLIQQYHDDMEEPGYDYAYVIPGFNRVMQAVGRLIRSERDRGVALLMDRRFGRPAYGEMMPEWWKPAAFARNVEDVTGAVKRFWDD
jgi:DNA excision repair protein ERCC-2